MIVTNLMKVDNDLLDDTTNESPSLKNGVKLLSSTSDWDIANIYFHSYLHPKFAKRISRRL